MAVSNLDPLRSTEAAQASAASAASPPVVVRQAGRPDPDGQEAARRQAAQLRESVVSAAEDFNHAFTLFDIQAKFSVHEATGQVIVDVVNTRTGEVIREIPPRELLDRYAQMLDILGLFLDHNA